MTTTTPIDFHLTCFTLFFVSKEKHIDPHSGALRSDFFYSTLSTKIARQSVESHETVQIIHDFTYSMIDKNRVLSSDKAKAMTIITRAAYANEAWFTPIGDEYKTWRICTVSRLHRYKDTLGEALDVLDAVFDLYQKLAPDQNFLTGHKRRMEKEIVCNYEQRIIERLWCQMRKSTAKLKRS